MAKLVYFPCKCIKRGDCFLPGKIGNLAVVTQGKLIPVAPCPRCVSWES